MNQPRLPRAALCALAMALAACGTAGESGGAHPSIQGSASAEVSFSASPSGPEPDPANPVGVVAFGHSGLTGEGTGGISESVPPNSWATGSSELVNSVYLRLTAARPETEGHVANTAEGGASAFTLPDQAERALQRVPYPALAIISTIDNDIRCDGTDDEHIPELGQHVANTLELITTASPNTQILVVGQLSRPDADFIRELVAHDPSVKAELAGTGMCDFYNPAGELVEENIETLTDIIEQYEAEQARVCAEYVNCHTDGGVRAAYVDKLENFSPDWAHLNIAGQAEEAEIMWPVVEEILGL